MDLRQRLGAMALALVLTAAHAGRPEPQIVQVRPSGSEVPANLLRLSLKFPAPVEGPVLPRIGLVLADGTGLQDPFLPQELWSPDGTTLTLLLHPGRVKTGLVAREKLGPVLREGEDVAVIFDSQPIKRWHIGPVDSNGPVASAWRMSTVRAGSRAPLVVTLDHPIDSQDTDHVAIVDARDHRVDGRAQLKNGETTWIFNPDAPWQTGEYRLAVRGTLEDSAGNRLGGHFETPMSSPPKSATDVFVTFGVDSPISAGRTRQTAPMSERSLFTRP